MTTRRELLLMGSLAIAVPSLSRAQAFPSKAIRLLVPFSAGGSPDLLARLVAQQLAKQLGQSVVVENRLGANGIVATEAVFNSAPDGHTLLFSTGSHTINPSIYRKLPYDTVRDFAAVSQLTVAPGLTLVVGPKFQAKTIADFIALAKSKDGNVSFGSPGVGNTLHLAGELLNISAGTRMLHVPYKGAAPALAAAIGGEVSAVFLSTAAAIIAIKAGQVRPLAVTSAQRIAALPDVPTLAEAGVAGFDYNGGWMGVFAPGKTPREVVHKLSSEIARALQVPEVREKMLGWESPPLGTTPEEFSKFINEDIEKFARIVKAAQVPMQ
jgi:tripartite-type tricarboxylate transporter receptor subunit TctC